MLPLRFEQCESLIYQPSGLGAAELVRIEPIEIRCQIKVFDGETYDLLDGVIDTGAKLSLFPYNLWQPFKTRIRWLKGVNHSPGVRGISGPSQSTQAGIVEIKLGGVSPEWSRRTPIVAKFASASTTLNFKDYVLLGMNALQFEGRGRERKSRRLVIDFGNEDAFLDARV